jgi:hypothetical protein
LPTQQDVSNHYTHGDLAAAIRTGIESLGKTVNAVTIDDLAPVDEFHIGGRQASEDFLGQLDLSPGKHALDVGLPNVTAVISRLRSLINCAQELRRPVAYRL